VVTDIIALGQDVTAVTGYTQAVLEQLYQAVKPHGQVLYGDRYLRPRPRALYHNGIKLMNKAPESTTGFKAASRPNQDAGASGASSLRVATPDRDNGVAAANCDLLLLRCPNTRLDAHGGGRET
jgi:hypothetical protein